MPQSVIRRATLEAFLARLGLALDRPARVYLIGGTTQVFEGWREWIRHVEFADAVTTTAPHASVTAPDENVKATEDDHRVLTCEETDLY